MRVVNHNWYLSLCKEHNQQFESANEEYQELENEISEILSNADDPENPPIEYYDLMYQQVEPRRKLEKQALYSILTATMFAEAFIYEYAVSSKELSSNYFRKYLDSLSLLSKWVVVPRLTIGTNFPTDSQAYQHLKKVIEVRNKLVHFKSQNLMGNEEVAKYYDENHLSFLKTAEITYKMTQEIIKELRKLDPEFFNSNL